MLRSLPVTRDTLVQSLGWEDPLKKKMATHSSTLAWKIQRMKEPGRLQSMGVAKSRTQLSDFTSLLLGNKRIFSLAILLHTPLCFPSST